MKARRHDQHQPAEIVDFESIIRPKTPNGRPKHSLRAAINAMCKECIYDPREKGAWRMQVEGCTSPNCPLFPVRPLSAKSKRPPAHFPRLSAPTNPRGRISGLNLRNSPNSGHGFRRHWLTRIEVERLQTTHKQGRSLISRATGPWIACQRH